MSSTDQRVVEMRFDNAQFERGVSQTLSTLDKLREGLQFNNAISGVGLIQNAIDGLKLGAIENGVDTISNKFSLLGIVGMETIRKLTDSALDAVGRIATAIPNQIKSGGWTRALNIENARFQLEGLKVAWEDVSKDLSYAVNGTAYGLDSAAKAAAQLSASGIKASSDIKLTADNVDEMAESLMGISSSTARANGDLDDMAISLRAISGVSAMTNSAYDDIANVFIRIAGQGRVMATDLNSLAARGLNAAATLAESMGVTEAELRNMVSKGQIDFQTFSDAMYDAFADHAVEANKTFQGALSNTKAALSKIGAEVADDLLPAATKVLNSVRMFINAVKTSIMPILNSVGHLIIALGGAISKAIDTVREKLDLANKSVTDGLGPIKTISNAIDTVTGKIEKFAGVVDDTAKTVTKSTKQQSEEVVATAVETEKNLDEIAKAVIQGQYSNGEERKRLLQEAGYSFEEVQNKVNEMLGCEKRYEVQAEDTTAAIEQQTEAVSENSEEIANNTELTKEQVSAINDSTLKNTLDGFINIGKTLGFVFTTFGGAVKEASTNMHSIELNGLSESFKNFTGIIIGSNEAMATTKNVIYDVVQGFANIFVAVAKIAGAVAKGVFETFTEIKGLNLDDTSKSFKDLTESLIISDDAANGLTQAVKILLTPIKIISPLVSMAARAFMTLMTGMNKASNGVLGFVGKSKVLDKVNGIINGLIGGFFDLIDAIKKTKGFNDFVNSCKELASVIGDFLLKAFNKLADKLAELSGSKGKKATRVVESLADAFGVAFEALSIFVDGVKKLFNGESRFTGFFKTIGGGISTFASNITSMGKKVVGSIGFTDIFTTLKEKAAEALGGSDFLSALFGMDKETISYTPDEHLSAGINSATTQATKAIKEEEKPKGLIGILLDAIEKLKDGLSSLDFTSGLKTLGDTLGDFFNSHDWVGMIGQALNFALLVSVIRRIWEGASFMKSARGVADSIAATFYSISDAIDIFSGKADRVKKSKIRDIAESLLLLVISVGALALLDKNGADVLKGIGMLSIILTELLGVYLLLAILDKKGKLGKEAVNSFSKTALALTGGLGILVWAMKTLLGFSDEEYIDGFKRLTFLMGAMIGMVTLMQTFSKIDISGGKFVALAVALTLALIPFTILAYMDYDRYIDGIGRLAMLMLAFGVTVRIMMSVTKEASGIKASALLALALDIVAIGLVLIMVSWIPVDQIKYAIGAIASTLLAFAAATNVAKINKSSGDAFKALALDILAIGLILMLLSKIDAEKIEYGIGAICSVLLAFGASMKLAGNSKNLSKTALALALDVVTIGAALFALSYRPWNDILVAALAISGVMFALVGAMKLTKGLRNVQEKALAFAIEVAAIGLSLAVLATQPWNQILVAGIAMAGIIFALVGAMQLTKGARNVQEKALAFAIEAAAIGLSLAVLATQPWTQIAAAGLAMVGVMLALSLSMKLISTVPPTTIGLVLAMSVAVIAIAAALMMVASIGNGVFTALLALAGGILVFVAAVALLGLVGQVFPVVIPLILVLSVAVIAVAAALYIGALAMEKITETVINGIAALQGLSAGVDDFSKMVGALCLAILEISGAVVLAGTALAITSPLLLIGAVALIAFGAALAVAGAGSVVASAGINALTDAVCKGIAKMASAIGSILAIFPKTKDLGKKLKSASTEINNSISNINTDQNAYKMMTGFATGLNRGKPQVDSAMSGVTSSVQSQVDTMAASGGEGGTGLMSMLTGNISGFQMDPSMLSSKLSEGGFSMENLGLTGSDLGGAFMGNFDSSLSGYSSTTNLNDLLAPFGISPEAASAEGSETGVATVEGVVSGTTNAANDPSNQIAMYDAGSALGTEATTGVEESFTPGSTYTADSNPIVDFVSKVTGWFQDKAASGNLDDKFSGLGVDNAQSYAEGLVDPSALSDIQVSTKKVNDSTINSLESTDEDAKSAGKGVVDQFNNGLKDSNSLSNVESSATDVADTSETPLDNAGTNAYTWGQHLGQNFADGIASKSAKVGASAKILANEVSKYLEHTTPDEGPLKHDDVWGIHLGQNLADGMLKMKSTVGKAALTLASNTSDAFLNNEDIEESAHKGAYVASMLAIGMLSCLDQVRSASEDLSNATELGIDMINTDPVIKPVLDLSNVYAGANRLSNMLNGATMYADMQADAITTSRSHRLQNESISGNGSTTNNAITNNITVNAAQGQSVREIADAVSERLNFEYQKKKGCWA